ncbi:MAG: alkanesulfonate monooxygenase SsuD [Candidatus Azotimanducaceae bacterium]|jgi:alkanesulfonate monooxygenase SsuD/methylene tetrahydromethanopterin reductase-like flavin-dependent oxidoreductase (luciferase family)
MSKNEKSLSIGTVGSNALLMGDFGMRADVMAMIKESSIDHLFIADHVSFHDGFGMDGLINAATLAAMNPEITVFLGVYLLALRHPVPVARQLSTLSLSAPGRIIFGVGIGGEDRHEMEVCGVDPATRGRRTNDCLHVVRTLLDGKPCSFESEFFSIEEAIIKPSPQPQIPIMIGGRSTAALKRTAAHGDGWLGVWCSPNRFKQATEEIESMAIAQAREDTQWRHGLQIWVGLDDDKDKARAILAKEMEAMYKIPFAAFEKYSPYGSAEEVAEFLLPYVKNGATVLNIKACAANPEYEVAKVSKICDLLKSEL